MPANSESSCGAFVVRAAVHHQDLDGRAVVGTFQRGQAAAQRGRAVIGKYQRRNANGGRKIDLLRAAARARRR